MTIVAKSSSFCLPLPPSGKFLADNIVGSVVVFSLVFWIPLSILVHCVVRRRRTFTRVPTVLRCTGILWHCWKWIPSQTILKVGSLCVCFQDKRLDQQYEENTKSFFYPPSVSAASVKWFALVSMSCCHTNQTNTTHSHFFKNTLPLMRKRDYLPFSKSISVTLLFLSEDWNLNLY